jgi:RNase P/RNase MRP subunit p30
MAATNGVAIEMNFREVLNASKNTRAKILKNMTQNMNIARNFSVFFERE